MNKKKTSLRSAITGFFQLVGVFAFLLSVFAIAAIAIGLFVNVFNFVTSL